METLGEIRPIKQDREADLLAIWVYVVSRHDVPAEEQIPTEIEDIPTDVIECRFVPHPGSRPPS
jgi:hypothetical protein